MSGHDAFHPDFPDDQRKPWRSRLHHIRAEAVGGVLAQTAGMRQFAAISGRTAGAERIWTGETRVAPGAVSNNRHREESETVICLVSGSPVFVFHEGNVEVWLAPATGDDGLVPPHVPHREGNPDSEQEASRSSRAARRRRSW